ncbi:MAG TPA: molybdopterin dinucleotide binding domain-containing protein, partial [Nevskiaceae bacterium]|nr:molybdopterin dinucleotide binding domain-containing protein [Nevskiaceae bacterium]
RARGARHIVVDPRRSETARHADLHLPVIPGEDATLIAGLIHVILCNGWENRSFCDRWVANVARLRDATRAFTPEHVARRCGVRAEDVVEAARMFGQARRAMAGCGTGTCMSPRSNLADFLVETLNALCGGYRQAGEPVRNRGLLFGRPPVAAVLPPDRTWEREPRCRSAAAGTLAGEFPTALLPDEILSKADDRIRALVVFSGNPAVAIVDPGRTLAALDHLDLLVTLDHRETETTRRSHYVVGTSTFYERHELSGYTEMMFDRDFVDYSRPILEKPAGVIHDWEFFWGVARALGLPLEYKYLGLLMQASQLPPGLSLSPETPPEEEAIIAWICRERGLSLDALRAAPGGLVHELPPMVVGELPEDVPRSRLDVCPGDVAAELDELSRSVFDDTRAYRLSSRRLPQVMNSLLRDDPGVGGAGRTNFAYMNPDDMRREGFADGEPVSLTSSYATIEAQAKADPGLRAGAVSIAHGFAGPGAAQVGRLVPLAEGFREPISFMPHQSGVPIHVRKSAVEPTATTS